MRVAVIGAHGFVGSAFVRHLTNLGVDVIAVTRHNYGQMRGRKSDVVIEAACNSKKYLAESQPLVDFDQSVAHRMHSLRDFPAELHVHLSSVDVYSDLSSPEMTREDSVPHLPNVSQYGFHKLLAEQIVQHDAAHWLIVRLAGMVGPGLRKNPVYDLLHRQPLRIHPHSKYQFMLTDDVARIAWTMVRKGVENEIFNVCGDGLISPVEIAKLVGNEPDLSLMERTAEPRIVHVSTQKVSQILPMPDTNESVASFIKSQYTQQSDEVGEI